MHLFHVNLKGSVNCVIFLYSMKLKNKQPYYMYPPSSKILTLDITWFDVSKIQVAMQMLRFSVLAMGSLNEPDTAVFSLFCIFAPGIS